MQHTPDLQCLLRNLNRTSVFLGWLRQEGDSLIAAASLLGGTKWAKRAHSLVEGAHAGHDIAARRKDLEALRRLLRFGGVTYVAFLHSLDDLPGRARLAVEDLERPRLELRDHAANLFSLQCHSRYHGFGHVMMGVLRALADDYGALVLMEFREATGGVEVIDITLIDSAYARGRAFDLGGRAASG